MLTCDDGKLKIDVEYLSQNPLFQLKVSKLSGCNLNSLDFIRHQHELRVLDLSYNLLNATFPSWLLENNAELEALNLHNNYFTGNFVLPSHTMRNIVWIDLSNNHLSGKIPIDFGRILPDLQCLSLPKNHFEGDLPSSISAMRELKVLDLSFNNFSREVPKEILESCAELDKLILSHNKFSGQIFSSHFNLSSLYQLDLSNNQFTGRLQFLETPSLSEGITKFDFINKNRANSNKGDILWYMSGLDLSCNNLTGKRSMELGHLSSLQALNLSHNQLMGHIPISFSNLDEVKSLDLSFNGLSGEIPLELTNLHFLEVFNVTHNNLSGRIPFTRRQFWTFEEISYQENPRLYGKPSEKLCITDSVGTPDLPNNSFKWKWKEMV
ncbi:hypothetical protein DITRI_Ditri16bG0135400 [Diplodiscus trichospermus]